MAENSTCFHLDSWQVFGMLSFTSALAAFLSRKPSGLPPKISPRIPCHAHVSLTFYSWNLDGYVPGFSIGQSVPGVCTCHPCIVLFECKEWRSRPQGIAICGFVLCGCRSVPWGVEKKTCGKIVGKGNTCSSGDGGGGGCFSCVCCWGFLMECRDVGIRMVYGIWTCEYSNISLWYHNYISTILQHPYMRVPAHQCKSNFKFVPRGGGTSACFIWSTWCVCI